MISTVALFLSLGGAGYAAFDLPSNSVGVKQLRDNAVSYKKIQPGAVGLVRANTGQLQERVSKSCAANTAISGISRGGAPTCAPTLPTEYGTTDNTAAVGASQATVTSVTLPTGASYLALANPTATITGGSAGEHVVVSCTLTVGSNTETRSATLDTVGQTGALSIPLEVAGQAGTATVSCASGATPTTTTTTKTTTTTTGTTTTPTPPPTPPSISVTATIKAIPTAGNS